ncbi:TetR/AcrR family transcriptional regulator [Streptomyces sp. MST-110588]|nr:TetR/AcrR family transcriptional regulator [Streptomyces sp. MST-110588]
MAVAMDELVEHGYDGLNLERVARRADVGRTTVYRRWGSPAGLAAGLLGELARRTVPYVDTGSLEGDLLRYATEMVAAFQDPRIKASFAAVIAASASDPEAAQALRDFHAGQGEVWRRSSARAVERGEIAAALEDVDLTRFIAGYLQWRLFISHEPIDDATARRAVHATLAAAHAGALTSAP